MQTLWFHPRLSESETLRLGHRVCGLQAFRVVLIHYSKPSTNPRLCSVRNVFIEAFVVYLEGSHLMPPCKQLKHDGWTFLLVEMPFPCPCPHQGVFLATALVPFSPRPLFFTFSLLILSKIEGMFPMSLEEQFSCT